jgi:hypothetical protein
VPLPGERQCDGAPYCAATAGDYSRSIALHQNISSLSQKYRSFIK